jgi:hypothetical protein
VPYSNCVLFRLLAAYIHESAVLKSDAAHSTAWFIATLSGGAQGQQWQGHLHILVSDMLTSGRSLLNNKCRLYSAGKHSAPVVCAGWMPHASASPHHRQPHCSRTARIGGCHGCRCRQHQHLLQQHHCHGPLSCCSSMVEGLQGM